LKNIVIIGGGGHAKVLASVIKKNNDFNILGYTDKKDDSSLSGVKYLGDDNVLEKLIKDNIIFNAVLGVGQINLNSSRRAIAERLLEIGLEFPTIASRDSIINRDVEIGKGTVVFDGVVINSGTKIGSFSIINTGVIIDHDCEIGDYTHIATGAVLSGGVKIKNNSMVGAGATIIQYKVICENCMIGAGSVVTEDCLENGVYAGIPARKIR